MNAMQNMFPGDMPGEIEIGGTVYTVKDWTDTFVIDTERVPPGTVFTANFLLNFFSSLTHQLPGVIGTPKLGIETTMREASRLPGGWVAVFRNIFFHIWQPSLRLDVENITRSAYLSFIIGNQKTEVDGPALLYPTPFGVGGIISLDGAGVATEVSEVNNGVIGRHTNPAKLPLKIAGGMQFRIECRFDFGFTMDGFGPAPGGIAGGSTSISIIIPAYMGKPVF